MALKESANRFSVTYEIVTPESAEDGDVAERGYVDERMTLREAIEEMGGRANEASSWPYDGRDSHAWFTTTDYAIDYRTCAIESRSLHLPRGLTAATRRRIARLLGVQVA